MTEYRKKVKRKVKGVRRMNGRWKHGWKQEEMTCEECGNDNPDRFAENFNMLICMDCLKDKEKPKVSIAKGNE